jgi:hypothetical protein
VKRNDKGIEAGDEKIQPLFNLQEYTLQRKLRWDNTQLLRKE